MQQIDASLTSEQLKARVNLLSGGWISAHDPIQLAVARARFCIAIAIISLVAGVSLGQVPATVIAETAPVSGCSTPTSRSDLAPHAAWAANPGAAITEVFLGAGLHVLLHHNDSRCMTSVAATGSTRSGNNAPPTSTAPSRRKPFRHMLLLFRKNELRKDRYPGSAVEVATSNRPMQ